LADRYVYGIHSVSGLMKNQPERIDQLFVRQGAQSHRLKELIQLANAKGCPVELIAPEKLDRLVKGSHQGVVLKVRPVRDRSEKDLEGFLADRMDQTESILLLILDGVTDPRNLGACIRSAAATGADAVIVPRRNSAELTPAAEKAASGGAELVPLFRVTNLGRTLDYLKSLGIWITGTSMDTDVFIYEVDLKGHCALVLGSEGTGMRDGVRKRCDFLATIPMNRDSFSFNVSVATGIILYEVARQRSKKV